MSTHTIVKRLLDEVYQRALRRPGIYVALMRSEAPTPAHQVLIDQTWDLLEQDVDSWLEALIERGADQLEARIRMDLQLSEGDRPAMAGPPNRIYSLED